MPTRRTDVIDAAMNLLDEAGLDELSTRRLAERLGVRVGALYWHLKDKDELLAELADRIVGECLAAADGERGNGAAAVEGGDRTESGIERLAATARALRRAMLGHRDGARLVAGHAVPGPNSLLLADRMIRTAREAGVPLPLAAYATDTLISYVTGFVLQEQRIADRTAREPEPGPAPALDPARLAGLPDLAEMLADGPPDDETAFTAGLGLITAGLRRTTSAGE
ncbi:TetR/AcrR family transcriptional regulator [Kitasatospora camelliae]|uniref:TetR/AcrR family transcriptional regulator n=1 Tax=Kitasatospora camelliae TaxID=3156397 RepID=A0AAU8JYW2_9ACTN